MLSECGDVIRLGGQDLVAVDSGVDEGTVDDIASARTS